eukprot:1073060-Pyramimonas_sp.AAC.1
MNRPIGPAGGDLRPRVLSSVLLCSRDGMPAKLEPRYTFEQRCVTRYTFEQRCVMRYTFEQRCVCSIPSSREVRDAVYPQTEVNVSAPQIQQSSDSAVTVQQQCHLAAVGEPEGVRPDRQRPLNISGSVDASASRGGAYLLYSNKHTKSE